MQYSQKDEFFHYRTPGSKNGVRLYQNEDGSLTLLGKKRYLKGERNKSLYYDPKNKPGFFDFYGKEKQKELKRQIQNNGGLKNYKGYERAEIQTAYIKPKLKGSEIIGRDKRLRKPFDLLDLNFNALSKNHEKNTDKSTNSAPSDQTEVDKVLNNTQGVSLRKLFADVNIDIGKQFILDSYEFTQSPLDFMIRKSFK